MRPKYSCRALPTAKRNAFALSWGSKQAYRRSHSCVIQIGRIHLEWVAGHSVMVNHSICMKGGGPTAADSFRSTRPLFIAAISWAKISVRPNSKWKLPTRMSTMVVFEAQSENLLWGVFFFSSLDNLVASSAAAPIPWPSVNRQLTTPLWIKAVSICAQHRNVSDDVSTRRNC